MQPVNEQQIYREQVDTVFRQLPMLLLLEILTGTLLFNFVILSTTNYSPLAFVWLVAVVISGVIRIFVERQYHDSDWSTNLQQRNRFLFISIFVSSLLWGTTWVLLPISIMEPPRGAIMLWPLAMLAIAATNLSIRKPLFYCFGIPTVALQIAAMFLLGSDEGLRYGAGMAVFFLFVSILAGRTSKDLNEAIRLKLNNKALEQSLNEDREKLQQQEAELLLGIRRERRLLEEKQTADLMLETVNEEKLRLLDAVGEGIFGSNAEGQITFVNEMALKLLGFEEDDVLGQDAVSLLCPSSAEQGRDAETREAILDCFQNGNAVSSMKGTFAGKNDSILPVNFSSRPIIKDGKFIGAVVSFFDISDQLAMESKLQRSQKIEAIGRITGGVAHDFNNLLTVIQGNLQFLRKRLRQKMGALDMQDEMELIEKMLTASKSGSELNNRLLSYSREQALQTSLQNVNSILEDMNKFVGRVLGEDIDFVLDLCETDSVVMLDRTQFENVILNLCMNARDAMPTGGRVTMRSKIVELAEDPQRLSGLPAGTYMELTIKDSGTGIAPEIQDKIFDPFFTTKKAGAGSGFGLSTAYGFMQQSGGSIAVHSRPGEGATFVLQIPLAKGEMLPVGESDLIDSDELMHSGTILVVEDDERIREIACMALMDAGYKIITAENGQTGLEKFREHPNIDLVFSDIIMPGGITGIELAKQILQQHPRMKVLLATGYTQKILRDSIANEKNIVCISKPYDFSALPELIDSLINEAA